MLTAFEHQNSILISTPQTALRPVDQTPPLCRRESPSTDRLQAPHIELVVIIVWSPKRWVQLGVSISRGVLDFSIRA